MFAMFGICDGPLRFSRPSLSRSPSPSLLPSLPLYLRSLSSLSAPVSIPRSLPSYLSLSHSLTLSLSLSLFLSFSLSFSLFLSLSLSSHHKNTPTHARATHKLTQAADSKYLQRMPTPRGTAHQRRRARHPLWPDTPGRGGPPQPKRRLAVRQAAGPPGPAEHRPSPPPHDPALCFFQPRPRSTAAGGRPVPRQPPPSPSPPHTHQPGPARGSPARRPPGCGSSPRRTLPGGRGGRGSFRRRLRGGVPAPPPGGLQMPRPWSSRAPACV